MSIDHSSEAAPGADVLVALVEALAEELPAAEDLRARLHADPELGHNERRTAKRLLDALEAEEIERFAGTGIAAWIGDSRPAVAIRAELDGLPIKEATGVPFAASGETMHACGHDVHMAALVALFRAAQSLHSPLPAPMLALFQPSEEAYPSGAELLTREGLLQGKAGAVVAAHLHPDVAWGAVSAATGPVNASSDNFRILVEGAGGHAGYPQQARDPIVAVAHVVVALQQVISRRLDPMHSGALTVGRLKAGVAENVIPDVAEAGGTLRVLDPSDRKPMKEVTQDIAETVARACGCAARVEWTEGEPAVDNHPALAESIRTLLPVAGFDVAPSFHSTGSDDFGFFAAVHPAFMAFVGLKGAPGMKPRPLHDPGFLPPMPAVPAVARALAAEYVGAALACRGSR